MPLTRKLKTSMVARFAEKVAVEPPKVLARGSSINILPAAPDAQVVSTKWMDRAVKPVIDAATPTMTAMLYEPPGVTRIQELYSPPPEVKSPNMNVDTTRRVIPEKPNDGRLIRRYKPALGNGMSSALYASTGKTSGTLDSELSGQENQGMTEKLYDGRLSAKVFGGAAAGAAAGASGCGATFAGDTAPAAFLALVIIGAVIGVWRGLL